MLTAKIVFKEDPTKKLNGLQTKLKNFAIRYALNKAASPVKAAVISGAPKLTGALGKSIRIKIERYKAGTVWVAVVGPKSNFVRGGKKKTIRPARYAHVLEGGSRYSMPRRFLAPALSRTHQQYFDILQSTIGQQIDQFLQ